MKDETKMTRTNRARQLAQQKVDSKEAAQILMNEYGGDLQLNLKRMQNARWEVKAGRVPDNPMLYERGKTKVKPPVGTDGITSIQTRPLDQIGAGCFCEHCGNRLNNILVAIK